MRWLTLFAAFTSLGFGQLPAPNEAGVSMGHIHLMLPDADAQIKAWKDVLGGSVTPDGWIKLPGIFISFAQSASATEGSDGSTVNHVGFLVKDYAALKAKLAAANIPIVFDLEKNKQIMVTFPEKVRVEFNEDPSLSEPLVFHHIHLMTTDPEKLQAWYVKTFGAEATTRRNLPAAKFPGGEVDFLKAKDAPAPTKDRTLDHIGFEVKDLEAFCKKLEADGIPFDVAFRILQPSGLKVAVITDPVGTRIALTQGLAGK